MQFKRKLQNISPHTMSRELKAKDNTIKVSSVRIIQIINTPEFWSELIDLVEKFVRPQDKSENND